MYIGSRANTPLARTWLNSFDWPTKHFKLARIDASPTKFLPEEYMLMQSTLLEMYEIRAEKDPIFREALLNLDQIECDCDGVFCHGDLLMEVKNALMTRSLPARFVS